MQGFSLEAFGPVEMAMFASWTATGLGLGLWLWSWLREQDPIKKLRFMDCGVIMIFAATLLRIALQARPMTPLDWALAILSPLFIAAAFWRLTRTGRPGGPTR